MAGRDAFAPEPRGSGRNHLPYILIFRLGDAQPRSVSHAPFILPPSSLDHRGRSISADPEVEHLLLYGLPGD